MAIQVRRGNEANFDADKMLPGEWATSIDSKEVRMCFAPGVTKKMATQENFPQYVLDTLGLYVDENGDICQVEE